MSRPRRLSPAAALGVAIAALALALPSVAGAVSPTQTDWTLRSSWVNYISNPLWANPAPITTSWSSLGSNTYGLPVASGSSSTTVRDHTGSIAFDDVVASLTSAGAELFNGGANGSYGAGDPFGDISVTFP